METDRSRSFYEEQYQGRIYAPAETPGEHGHHAGLRRFIDDHGLHHARCLEVGCGRGAFQDLVEDYTGCDLAESVRPSLRKPFVRASATDLPIPGGEFDAVWSVQVLEHVPGPQRALEEMRRVLRDGGLLYLAPAWQCRPWAAEGYPVRPWRDFGWKDRLIKLSIPLRDAVWFRALYVFPRRLARLLTWAVRRRPLRFRCRELRPNYERFWMSDSDAVNSMDPHEAILWFVSRGDECLSHRGPLAQFLVRTGALVFRIRKGAG